MLMCWRHNPKQRPQFVDIVRDLCAKDISSHFCDTSYVHSEEYALLMESRTPACEEEQPLDGDDDLHTPLTQSREHLDSTSDDTCSHAALEQKHSPRERHRTSRPHGGRGDGPESLAEEHYSGLRHSQPSTHSSLSNPSQPAISYSSEGSKDSSKSSSSSHQHTNGLANGHIPKHRGAGYAEC